MTPPNVAVEPPRPRGRFQRLGSWGTLLPSLTYASVFRRIFEIAAVEWGYVGSKATSGNPGRLDPGSVLPSALPGAGRPRPVHLRQRDA